MPVYLLVLAGAILRKTGVLKREHDEGVMRVVFSVMLPCYILDKILGSEVLRSGAAVAWSIGLGFGLLVVGILIGLLIGRILGFERGTGMRTFALGAGCQNFGFVAVPVYEIMWGTAGLAVLFVHNIGVELAMWSVGVMIMAGGRGFSWRRLFNGPVVAVMVGLTLVALGLDQQVTGSARKAMSMIGIGSFPVAILITGCTMMELVGAEKPSGRVIVGASLVRLVLAPLTILCAAKYFPLPMELRQVLVVQAAMPAGMTSIMLARMYGGRPAIAVQIVLATSILSFLTLPWIITWGSQWVGLKPLLP